MEAFAFYLLKSVICYPVCNCLFPFSAKGTLLPPEKILPDCRYSYLIHLPALYIPLSD